MNEPKINNVVNDLTESLQGKFTPELLNRGQQVVQNKINKKIENVYGFWDVMKVGGGGGIMKEILDFIREFIGDITGVKIDVGEELAQQKKQAEEQIRGLLPSTVDIEKQAAEVRKQTEQVDEFAMDKVRNGVQLFKENVAIFGRVLPDKTINGLWAMADQLVQDKNKRQELIQIAKESGVSGVSRFLLNQAEIKNLIPTEHIQDLVTKNSQKLKDFLSDTDNEIILNMKLTLRRPVTMMRSLCSEMQIDEDEVVKDEILSMSNFVEHLEDRITLEKYNAIKGDKGKIQKFFLSQFEGSWKNSIIRVKKSQGVATSIVLGFAENMQKIWNNPDNFGEYTNNAIITYSTSLSKTLSGIIVEVGKGAANRSYQKLIDYYRRINNKEDARKLEYFRDKEEELTMDEKLEFTVLLLKSGFYVAIDGTTAVLTDPKGSFYEVSGIFGYTEQNIAKLADRIKNDERYLLALLSTRLGRLVVKVAGKTLYLGAKAVQGIARGTEFVINEALSAKVIAGSFTKLSTASKQSFMASLNNLFVKIPSRVLSVTAKANYITSLSRGYSVEKNRIIFNDLKLKLGGSKLDEKLVQGFLGELGLVVGNQGKILSHIDEMAKIAQRIKNGKTTSVMIKNLNRQLEKLGKEIAGGLSQIDSKLKTGKHMIKSVLSFNSQKWLAARGNLVAQDKVIHEMQKLTGSLTKLEAKSVFGVANGKKLLRLLNDTSLEFNTLNQLAGTGGGGRKALQGVATLATGISESAKLLGEGVNTFYIYKGIHSFIQTGDWLEALDSYMPAIPVAGPICCFILQDGVVHLHRDKNGEIQILAEEHPNPLEYMGRFAKEPHRLLLAGLGAKVAYDDIRTIMKAQGVLGKAHALITRPLTAPFRMISPAGKVIKCVVHGSSQVIQGLHKGGTDIFIRSKLAQKFHKKVGTDKLGRAIVDKTGKLTEAMKKKLKDKADKIGKLAGKTYEKTGVKKAVAGAIDKSKKVGRGAKKYSGYDKLKEVTKNRSIAREARGELFQKMESRMNRAQSSIKNLQEKIVKLSKKAVEQAKATNKPLKEILKKKPFTAIAEHNNAIKGITKNIFRKYLPGAINPEKTFGQLTKQEKKLMKVFLKKTIKKEGTLMGTIFKKGTRGGLSRLKIMAPIVAIQGSYTAYKEGSLAKGAAVAADLATSMIPIVGTIKDIKNGNYGMAAVGVFCDAMMILGGTGAVLRGLATTARFTSKVAKAGKNVSKLVKIEKRFEKMRKIGKGIEDIEKSKTLKWTSWGMMAGGTAYDMCSTHFTEVDTVDFGFDVSDLTEVPETEHKIDFFSNDDLTYMEGDNSFNFFNYD